MEVGDYVGQCPLLGLARVTALVGSRLCQPHRVQPGSTADRSKVVADLAELGADAVTTLGYDGKLSFGGASDAFGLGLSSSCFPSNLLLAKPALNL